MYFRVSRWTLAVGLVGLVAVVTAIVAVGIAVRGQGASRPVILADPAVEIERHLSRLSPEGPYRDPDRAERAAARTAARLVATGDFTAAGEVLGELGFTALHAVDPVTYRPYVLFLAVGTDDRTWGAVLVDQSASPQVVVEVPHPRFDINTEQLGMSLHRRMPGSVLLVAGAHREAGDGAGDVAHNDRSFFHLVATELARHELPQIQLHGFATKNLPDADAVVSTGVAEVTDLSRAVADGLDDVGLAVCRGWLQRCGRLEGTRNEQSRSAAELSAVFLHLELSYAVRRDGQRREMVAGLIGESVAAAQS